METGDFLSNRQKQITESDFYSIHCFFDEEKFQPQILQTFPEKKKSIMMQFFRTPRSTPIEEYFVIPAKNSKIKIQNTHSLSDDINFSPE